MLRTFLLVSAILVVVMLLLSGCTEDDQYVPFRFEPFTKNPVVVMETTVGDITVELYEQASPVTVENFLRYMREEYYDSLIFHRVIPNFVVQGGQYDVHLQKKPAHDPIPCEADNGLSNKRGTIGMARTHDIHSATSQFYINVKDNPAFDHDEIHFGYAVFGRVIAGMSVVDSISNVETTSMGGLNNLPVEPVIIWKIYLQI